MEALNRSDAELCERLRFETPLADLSARFVDVPPDQIDHERGDALRRLCEFIKVDVSGFWQIVSKDPLDFLYRIRMSLEQARAVLLDYLKEVNHLAEQPRWYNALTHNCTTTIRLHAQHVSADRPWDWRFLANGRLDELGYERGQIDTSLPFAELKARSDITARARAAGLSSDFSARIRAGLPGMSEERKLTGKSSPS